MANAAEEVRSAIGIKVTTGASQSLSSAERRLAQAVSDRLWRHEPFRASGARVEITAEGRRIKLSGCVRTQAMKYLAGYVAQGVEGVDEVGNALISDMETIQSVADALAGDPLTRPHVVRVRSIYGAVKLEGVVPSLEVERQAVAVARSVPHVVSVQSELEIGS